MNKKRLAAVLLPLMLLLGGCGQEDLPAGGKPDGMANNRAAEEMEQTERQENT